MVMQIRENSVKIRRNEVLTKKGVFMSDFVFDFYKESQIKLNVRLLKTRPMLSMWT